MVVAGAVALGALAALAAVAAVVVAGAAVTGRALAFEEIQRTLRYRITTAAFVFLGIFSLHNLNNLRLSSYAYV